MHRSALNKYRIGLGLIGLFTLIILIVVVSQASATRQDQETANTANTIANQLNNYIDSSYSGATPRSLAQAGITNVPSTITYTRLSSDSYQFCMTYKTTSTNFNATEVTQDVILRGFGSDESNDPGSYNNLSNLEINPVHHKGTNCETVNLYDDFIDNSQ